MNEKLKAERTRSSEMSNRTASRCQPFPISPQTKKRHYLRCQRQPVCATHGATATHGAI